MNDLMIDTETLGTSVGSPIISVAAVFFDPESGTIGRTFYRIVQLDSALKHGQIEPSTLSWWMAQSDKAREIFASSESFLLEDVLNQLSCFIKSISDPKEVRVWGNGPSFDNAILAYAYKSFGQQLPWAFRNDRDVRTIADLAKRLKNVDAISLTKRHGVHHNSLDDAVYQAAYVSLAYRALKE